MSSCELLASEARECPCRFRRADLCGEATGSPCEGIVIYSIDENGVDDGGQVTTDRDIGRSPDIGFRLIPADRRGVLILDPPAGKDAQ